MPDFAIFADTRNEPPAVYAHLRQLAAWSATAGLPVYLVGKRDLAHDTTHGVTEGGTDHIRIPAFVQGKKGKAAILPRQCTERYKIEPIKRHVRGALGAKTNRVGAVLRPPVDRWAEQWIGFSLDEVDRVNDHKGSVPYIKNRYPLLDLKMTREDCTEWLEAHGWPNVERSACIVCPYHGDDEWIDMRDHRPEDWAYAVAFDRRIRERRFKGARQAPFLHRDLLPLDVVTLVPGRGSGRRGCSPHGCRTMDGAVR